MSYKAAVIEGSEISVLRSELTSKDYLISVSLPYGYHHEIEKKWPVVYHIDGNTYYGMVTDIVRSMAWCGPTSDAIVVAIGYAGETQLKEAWNDRIDLRYHDLTPVQDDEQDKKRKESNGREVKSGGGENFLEFINSEIIPFVESNYRVDEKKRTLAGHSLGGLFTLYAMFQNPGQFENFVACSPSIYWKGQVMLEIEKDFASKRSALPLKLFLSMGELENDEDDEYGSFNGMQRLIEQLESRRYEQLKMKIRIFEDEDHCTVIAPSLAAGLKFALRDD
jgi:predicted alpha/beta superfamily hydrolase